MFSGFRSRWMTPRACAAATAETTCKKMEATSGRDILGPRDSLSASDSPESSSMIITGAPSSSATSCTATTLGWSSSCAILASRSRRKRTAPDTPFTSLSATRAPVSAWLAAQTTPMPPSPSSRSSR
ncbi:hypothetical protein BE20_30405 [Sorangium cellulosum]|nr:hypothetical protein BE20_30405 [Sorangium cellulosum]